MPSGEIVENWAIRLLKEKANAALESVWRAKREYWVELAKRRALRFSTYRKAHKQISNPSEGRVSALRGHPNPAM
jgi:hypothetical protein